MLQIPRINTKQYYHKISFKGSPDKLLGKTNPPVEIKILPNTDEYFAKTILNCINNFPSYWLRKFKQENYRVIISKNLQDAFTYNKINASEIEYFHTVNPSATLSTTYIDKNKGIKFFAFNNNCPLCLSYAQNNVTHEFCHGIVDIKHLNYNQKAIECLFNDINSTIKSKTVTNEEMSIFKTFFFNKYVKLPKDEIMADVLAWNAGSGKYGSGVVFGIQNKNLMRNLFPSLSKYLAKNVEHIKD